MNDILYCFKLDKETGEVNKVEITDYSSGRFVNNKSFYRYKVNGNLYYAYSSDLDRFKNDHVYSFNGDFDRAVEIIRSWLIERNEKEYAIYEKHKGVLDALNERY